MDREERTQPSHDGGSGGGAELRPASALYQWANEAPSHGMASISELLDQGYAQVGAHPRYRGTILMAKEVPVVT